MVSTQLSLDLLIARAQITDTVIKYATSIDRREWEEFRSIFADEVDVDFSSLTGVPGAAIKAEDWVLAVQRTIHCLDATHHLSTNHVVEFNEDGATCTSYMVAQHMLASAVAGNSYTLWGRYKNRLRCTEGGWKIFGCQLTIDRAEGNRQMFDVARERFAQL